MIRTNIRGASGTESVDIQYTIEGINTPTPSSPVAVAFGANSLFAGVACASAPYFEMLKNTGGTWAKMPTPATVPENTANCIALSADANYIALGTNHYGNILYLYKRTGDTIAKLANPSTYPNSNGIDALAFSDDGALLVYGHRYSGTLGAYKRENDTFTALPFSTGLGTLNTSGLALAGNGSRLAFTSPAAPFFASYTIGANYTFTRDPTFLPNLGAAGGCALNYDGSVLAISLQNAPYLRVFRNGVELPVEGLPIASILGGACAMSRDGRLLALTTSKTPYAYYYAIKKDRVIPINSTPFTANSTPSKGLAFSADGMFAATPNQFTNTYGIQRQSPLVS